MDRLLVLKGKLEMAKRTIQLQQRKPEPIEQTEKKTLVYQDEDSDVDMDQDSSSGDDVSEEEIAQIPLQGGKRARKEAEASGSDDDFDDYGLDDDLQDSASDSHGQDDPLGASDEDDADSAVLDIE